MAIPRIEVITPLYNEVACFDAYVEAVERVLLSRTDAVYDFLLIDDGSSDNTWELIERLCRRSPHFRGLRLSRNFGGHAAVTAGIDYCEADAVAVLSADLQDPPEVIVAFVEAWRRGADVVWGRRRTRGDARWRIIASNFLFMLLRRFAMPRESKFTTGGFFLIDRKVTQCVRELREHNRVTFGLVAWTGFQQDVVEYDRRGRVAGQSSWSFNRMVKTMYDALIGFSTTLPRLVTFLGMVFATLGFLATLFFLFNALFSKPLPGWSGIMITLTFFFGLTFLILGTVGEYLLRIYLESVRRPLYFVASDTRTVRDDIRRQTAGADGSAVAQEEARGVHQDFARQGD